MPQLPSIPGRVLIRGAQPRRAKETIRATATRQTCRMGQNLRHLIMSDIASRIGGEISVDSARAGAILEISAAKVGLRSRCGENPKSSEADALDAGRASRSSRTTSMLPG